MKYWAFISYSHQDSAWVEWLHRAVETYRVPRRLVGRPLGAETVPRRLFPVFRDRDELPSSAELGGAINEALRQSRNLIVVCSPRSATSRWVNEEIKAFRALGRSDRIFCLIVDGEPHASTRPDIAFSECFAPALREDGFEPIAADARERADGKANARLKLISGLLNVGFDELKQREKQRQFWQRIQIGAAALAFCGMVAGAWQWYQHQRDAREREITIEKLVENGRLELLEGHQARAAAYLNEAYKMGHDTVPLRFMLGQAMLAVDALTDVRVHHGGGHVRRALFSPDGERFVLLVEVDEKVVAKVYDADSGAELAAFGNLPRYPRVVEFLEGGRQLFVSGYRDSSQILHQDAQPATALWDIEARRQIIDIRGGGGRSGNPVHPSSGSILVAGDRAGLAIVSQADGTTDYVLAPQRMFSAASYSPDGRLIVSADINGHVDLWAANNPHARPRQLAGFEGQRVVGVQFTPDGSRALAYSQFGDIRIWDVASGSPLLSFAADGGWISRIAFSGNGRRLLTIGSEGYRVWSAARGALLFSLPFNQLWSADAAISSNGDYLYVADTASSSAEVWAVRSRSKLHSLDAHSGGVTALALDHSGSRLLLASLDGTAEIWDAAVNPLLSIDTAPNAFYAARFMPSQKQLMLAGGTPSTGTISILDHKSGEVAFVLNGHTSNIRDASISADGQHIISGSFDGTASIWNLPTKAVTASLDHRPLPVNLARISPRGDRMVTATYSDYAVEHRTASLWDMPTGHRIADLVHSRPVYALAFTSDGAILATASEDKTVKLWSTSDGQLRHTLRGHTGPVTALAFDPGGKTLVTAGQDSSIRFWDVRTGESLHADTDSSIDWGMHAAFSPDGKTVAIGTRKGVIWIVRTDQGLREAMKGHRGEVIEVRYSHNGQLIFSRSLDGTIRAWDPVTLSELAQIAAPGGAISSMDLDKNEQRLVAASTNYAAGIWSIALETRSPATIANLLNCKSNWHLVNQLVAPKAIADIGCE